MSMIRSRWAALGAAVAITLGGGGIGLVGATVDSGERSVFVPITPCRIIDTRPAFQIGTRATPLGRSETHTVSAHGTNGDCTIPADAGALSLNVTAVGATLPTFLTIWATGATMPDASSLNPAPGQPPTPNAVTTELSDGGQFEIYNLQGSVHVLADVNGYYADHTHDDRYYTESEVDTLIANNPGPEGPPGADGADGADGTDLYTRTVIVKADGTPAVNGAAIDAAIATVQANSPTADDPWQIILEPGIYDLGGTGIDLPDHASLHGAGVGQTMVAGTATTTVTMGSGTLIEHLSIDNGTALTSPNPTPVMISGESDVTVRNVELTLSGTSSTADGVRVNASTDVLLDGVRVVDSNDDGLSLISSSVQVVRSEILSDDPAVNSLGSNGMITIVDSRLETTDAGEEVIALQGSGPNVVSVLRSSIVQAAGPTTFSIVGTQTFTIVDSFVDVTNPSTFSPAAGTWTCAGNTTPTSFSATICV